MLIPILVLATVFILIAVRQVGNVKLQIWQIMPVRCCDCISHGADFTVASDGVYQY
jgi:hypothetical protein